ncbi:MobF family relaxase [Pseudonocardia sp. H11422]|uniref:MobF family relaxase n=1 Tax=Pseudonocardia sp. H11422 TaxID=2835866 RepID=UPI001BDBCD78|nr:MobF family relaxase [Pseudonocardia sp. H11422]
MLSLAIGHDVGYLTGPVAGGREGYYTGAVAAGEPAGLWYGGGAEQLGLTGEVDAELIEAVYMHLLDPRDPATGSRSTWGEAAALAAPHRRFRSAEQIYAELAAAEPQAGPERRAKLHAHAEVSSRQAVAFIDATFSAPKSVTVLGVAFERAANDARAAGDERAAEAWSEHQRAVEDAVLAGARAGLDYLQDAAGYARAGHHGGGGGRWVDAHAFVVAQFLQHDSRDRDPQLHVHNAILNRVRSADGKWRTLDSRTIHAHRGAAGAVAERVMEAHLARTLGVELATRPDGRAREVVGIGPAVLELFSSRRHAITAHTRELVDAFTSRFGREPSPLERTRLAQQATLATRAAKSPGGESLGQRLDRWEREARQAVAGGLNQIAHDVVARAQQPGPAGEWSVQDVVERALANVGRARASWSRADLLRAVSDELPGQVGLAPEQVRPLLERLTDTALGEAVPITPTSVVEELPDELRRADGESMFVRPGSARFSTPGQLAAERMLRRSAISRGAPALDDDAAASVIVRFAESGHELGADQAAAVRGVLTSGARVEVLAAAAGTGKTFTVGALTEAWQETGRRVLGLAPSQVAADLLAAEGLTATNTARWLTNSVGEMVPRESDLVVVDEAGMTSTGELAEIVRRCDAAGAKLLLVGDPRQLGAVGPGGALADVAARGITYELGEVRRFSADWEPAASLQLREGDPQALDAYERHGRLVSAGTAEQAESAAARAWLADTLAGRESVLIVGSNVAAARVGAALRSELVDLGRVEETGVELRSQGTVAGVGDLVQARRNGWDLVGFAGNTRAPINRSTYRVTALRADGGLSVTPASGGESLELPPTYVQDHLALAYASTVHAAQGRTVDTSHAVLAPGTDAAGLYVALTRGRDANTAWTVTRPLASDAFPGQTLDKEPHTARAVLTDSLAAAEADRTALAEQEQAEITARSTLTHAGQLIEGISHVTAGRTAATLDRLTADGVLAPQIRQRLAADEALGSLDRLLRTVELAGHDPAAVLTAAIDGRSLVDARSPAQVLHHRIMTTFHGRLTPEIESAVDLVPRDAPAGWAAWLRDRADAVDQRRYELGSQLAQDPPEWTRAALGPVPDDFVARAEWERRAGWAAAYRELAGHDDVDDPLGAAPPAGLAESATMFRAAHRALDLPEAGAEEADLSDGQLRMRVRAYERETAWAPRWVGDELDQTHQRAAKAAADAEIWTAHADAASGEAERDQLRAAAEQARAEAESLKERAAQLESADQARASWYAHTAQTRDRAERARVELGARGVDLAHPSDQVTAEEWLAVHTADQRVEDEHREISELDLADDRSALDEPTSGLETTVPDIRDHSSAADNEAVDRQPGRVPTVDETTAAVARAQLALAEIAARDAADSQREADEEALRDSTSWQHQIREEETTWDTDAVIER